MVQARVDWLLVAVFALIACSSTDAVTGVIRPQSGYVDTIFTLDFPDTSSTFTSASCQVAVNAPIQDCTFSGDKKRATFTLQPTFPESGIFTVSVIGDPLTAVISVLTLPIIGSANPLAVYPSSMVTLIGSNFIPGFYCTAKAGASNNRRDARNCTVTSASTVLIELDSGATAGPSSAQLFFNNPQFDVVFSGVVTVLANATIASVSSGTTYYSSSTITVTGGTFAAGQQCSASTGADLATSVAAGSCSIMSITSAVVVMNAGTAASPLSLFVYIRMSNPKSLLISTPVTITVNPVPTFTSISSAFAYVGSTLTVSGTNFIAGQACTAAIGNVATSSCRVLDNTNVEIVVKSGSQKSPIAASDVSVRMSNPSSLVATSFPSLVLTVLPLPTITNLEPRTAYAGSTITVTGSDFIRGIPCTAKLGIDAASAFDCRNCTVLNATILVVEADVSQPGSTSWTLFIFLSDFVAPLVQSSSSLSIVILQMPSIASTRVSLYRGSIVTITGTNFISSGFSCSGKFGNSIFSGAVTACSVISSTSLIVSVPLNSLYGLTSFEYMISNPQLSVRSTGGTFEILSNPSISGARPAQGYAGSAVTILGSNFIRDGQVCQARITTGDVVTLTLDSELSGAVNVSCVQLNIAALTNISALSIETTAPEYKIGSTTALSDPDRASVVFQLSQALAANGSIIFTFPPGFVNANTTCSIASPASKSSRQSLRFSNGTIASPCSIASLTSLTVVVGPGTAVGNSFVSVSMSNPSSIASISLNPILSILPAPVINSIYPTSGYVGSTVTVIGASFVFLPGNTRCEAAIGTSSEKSAVESCNYVNGSVFTFVISSSTPVSNESLSLFFYDSISAITVSLLSSLTIFPVPATFLPSPTAGYTGSTITLNGKNFISHLTCSVKFCNSVSVCASSSYCSIFSSSLVVVVVPTVVSEPLTISVAFSNPGNLTVSSSMLNDQNQPIFRKLDSPTIIGLSSNQARAYRNSLITVTGTNFISGFDCTAHVSADGTNFFTSNPCTIIDSNSFTLVVGTQAADGACKIRINMNNPSSVTSVSSSTVFTIVPNPRIISLSPTLAYAASTVAITGLNFISFPGNTSCRVDILQIDYLITSTMCTILSDTSVVFAVPSTASTVTSASIQVYMNNPASANGTNSSDAKLSIMSSPTISGVVPSTAYVGGVITVSGSNFMPLPAGCEASIISSQGVSSAAASCSIFNSTSAVVVIGASTSAAASSVSLKMTNPSSVTATSAPAVLMVANAPKLTSVNPAVVYAGSTITISGGTFIIGQSCSASVGTNPSNTVPTASCVVLDFQSTVIVLSHATVPGQYNVYMRMGNPSNLQVASSSLLVTVSSNPTISSISPSAAYVGSSVTITGSNFIGVTHNCTVTVGLGAGSSSEATSCRVLSSTSIAFVIASATQKGSPLNVYLRMANPTTAQAQSSSASLTVMDAPTILGISPTAIYMGRSLTVSGTSFIANHPCQASFGIIAATSCSFVAASAPSSAVAAIILISSSTPAGTYVVFINFGNPSTISLNSSSTFVTVAPAPVVSEIYPTSAFPGKAAYSGSTISIIGTNFIPASAGEFDRSCLLQLSATSTAASPNCTIVSPSLILFVTPIISIGSKSLSLNLGSFGSTTVSPKLLVRPPFSVDSVEPSSAYSASVITVSGSFIYPGYSCAVYFGVGASLVPSSNCSLVSSSKIIVVIPTLKSLGSTVISVSLTNPMELIVDLLEGLQMFDSPSLDPVPPSSPNAYPGSTLTVTGSNFITEGQTCKAFLGASVLSAVLASSCLFASSTSVVVVLSASTPPSAASVYLFIETSNPIIPLNRSEVSLKIFDMFTIQSITPSVAQRGDVVVASGANFISSASCVILLGTSNGILLSCNISSNNSASFAVPTSSAFGRFSMRFIIAGASFSIASSALFSLTVAGNLGPQLPRVSIDFKGARSIGNTMTIAMSPESGLSSGAILLTLTGFGEANSAFGKRVPIASNVSSFGCNGRASFLSAAGRPLQIVYEGCSVPSRYPVTIVISGIGNPSKQPITPVGAAVVVNGSIVADRADNGTLEAVMNSFSVQVSSSDPFPKRTSNLVITVSGLSTGIVRLIITLTGSGWAAESKFVSIGGIQSTVKILSSVLSADFSTSLAVADAVFTVAGVVHPSASQPASTAVAAAALDSIGVIDVCKSGSLVGLSSDLSPPATTIVKFTMTVVLSANFDRDVFMQVLATEMGCSPLQIYIDWQTAGLSATVVRTHAGYGVSRRSSSVSVRAPVTLQAEFRWTQFSDSAVDPSTLVARLESKLTDPNSPLKTQLGITGITRPSTASPPEVTSGGALSGGAIAGIVIAVLVVVFAAVAWYFRQSLQGIYEGWQRTRARRSAVKPPPPTGSHLNDISIVSGASEPTIIRSPPASDVPLRASPFVNSNSSPPQKSLPPPPAAHFHDTNRFSMVYSGAKIDDLAKDMDEFMQGDFGDDDIVDITNMDESDIVSIDFDGGDFQEAADIGDVNYLP